MYPKILRHTYCDINFSKNPSSNERTISRSSKVKSKLISLKLRKKLLPSALSVDEKSSAMIDELGVYSLLVSSIDRKKEGTL